MAERLVGGMRLLCAVYGKRRTGGGLGAVRSPCRSPQPWPAPPQQHENTSHSASFLGSPSVLQRSSTRNFLTANVSMPQTAALPRWWGAWIKEGSMQQRAIETRKWTWWRCCAVLLLLALTSLPLPVAAQDCPGDIGCTSCLTRVPRDPLAERPIICGLIWSNGGCACFTWFEGSTEHCQNYGSCIYTGWQGGPPPPV